MIFPSGAAGPPLRTGRRTPPAGAALPFAFFWRKPVWMYPSMCSIVGFCAPFSRQEELLGRLSAAFPSGAGATERTEGACLSVRCRAGRRPEQALFQQEGDLLVCDGVFYNADELRRQVPAGNSVSSTHSCAMLLPLFEQHGLSLFSRLNGEFALVLADSLSGSLVAARDPLGIRPLFYGYDENGFIAFASEAAFLVGLCPQVRPFPPGHYYAYGSFVRYSYLTQSITPCRDGLEQTCRNIHDGLIRAVERRLDTRRSTGFLLSGGVDSSLVCALSARCWDGPIRTFSIGMDTDAIDLKYAREVARVIGARHTEIIMTRQEVLSALESTVALLGTWDITTVRAGVGMALCCRAIRERTDVELLLTGEISDELFGYKYADFAPSPQAFQAETCKRVEQVSFYDVLRADRCMRAYGLEGLFPFGDLDFVRYVLSIDPRLKINTYGMGKYLLRHAFRHDGLLPEDILWRHKAAFSDSVGHSMVDDLKAYAESRYSDDAFRQQSRRYEYCPPFTKESLLYRDLFEQYYPGQGEMIPAFWMPNRDWPGCDVDDPSARALPNYNGSGR